jgi:hypothetical protein
VIPLTYDEATNLLDECVNEMGKDYTTPKCMYFFRDKPMCLIGHVLAKLGVEPSVVDGANGAGIGRLIEELNLLTVDQATIDLLATAQHWNDGRRPWGEAVKLAKTDPYHFS